VGFGSMVTDVWQRLVREQDRFTRISTEDLFGMLVASSAPEMQAWVDYIGARYPWVQAGSQASTQESQL
jgi:hypothetical protein